MLFKEFLVWAFWVQNLVPGWVKNGKKSFFFIPVTFLPMPKNKVLNSQCPNTLSKLKYELTDLQKILQKFTFYWIASYCKNKRALWKSYNDTWKLLDQTSLKITCSEAIKHLKGWKVSKILRKENCRPSTCIPACLMLTKKFSTSLLKTVLPFEQSSHTILLTWYCWFYFFT